MADQGKRKSGQWQDPARKRAKWSQGNQRALPAETQGVFITCDGFKERVAAVQMMSVFEEHYEALKKRGDVAKDAAAADAEDTRAIPDRLAEELEELRDSDSKLFKVHHGSLTSSAFIIFPDAPVAGGPGPVEVCTSVLQAVKDARALPSRAAIKLFPLTHTCALDLDEMATLAGKVVPQHFPEGDSVKPVTYAVEYEHRGVHQKLDRMAIINLFTQLVPAVHKVSLDKPDVTILVQLIRNVCGVSVIPGFSALAKFNMRKLLEQEDEEHKPPAKSKVAANSAQAPEGAKGAQPATEAEQGSPAPAQNGAADADTAAEPATAPEADKGTAAGEGTSTDAVAEAKDA